MHGRLAAVAAAVQLGLGLLLGLGLPADAAPSAHKLPPTMPLCKKTDPLLNDCIRDAIMASLPNLVKGLPGLGVPPVDPLHLPGLYVDNGQGAVSIKLSISDFLIGGLQDIRVTNFQVDLDKPRIWLEADLDRLTLGGQYSLEGKVLLLPISGEGQANLTMDDGHYSLDIDGKFVEKHGRRYLDVDGFTLKIHPGKLSIHFTNGDEALGKQMNQFLNENSEELWAELSGPMEEAFGQSLKYIAKRLFSKVPYDENLPGLKWPSNQSPSPKSDCWGPTVLVVELVHLRGGHEKEGASAYAIVLTLYLYL